ncbi:MAG TPA: sigma 54-interacting transcriptional regulator, partial [Polyangiaceae bacterium]
SARRLSAARSVRGACERPARPAPKEGNGRICPGTPRPVRAKDPHGMVTGDPTRHDERTTIEHTAAGPPSSRRGATQAAAMIVYQRGRAELVEIGPDRAVTIGREWPADVLVADPSLSRQHARFEWVAGTLTVTDLGSRNGTWVSGKRVAETSEVRSGGIVQLGGVSVSIHLAETGSPIRGLDTYDALLGLLDEELSRARHFTRSFALLALTAATGTTDGHVSRWCPRVRSELRDIDRLATYSADSALVLLPESDGGVACDLARKLTKTAPGEPALAAGVAVFPASGTSAAEIVAAARGAALGRGPGTVTLADFRAATAKAAGTEAVVVKSPKMHALYALLRRIAKTTVPVLLLGETGSGKEVVARALHESSARAEGPLQAVNCAAIPQNLTESVLFGHERGAFTGADRTARGLFEEANHGTLLLDEIGELPLTAQGALLRVLESKQVVRVGGNREIPIDVRVVAATNRDLESMVAEGKFREDLLFRLNAVALSVPPLRERREEIAALSRLFVRAANLAWGTAVGDVTEEAIAALEEYSWPGNVRELRNAMERAVAICASGAVGLSDLPERIRSAGGAPSVPPVQSPVTGESARITGFPPGDRAFRERVREFESQLIVEALEQTAGNQSRAAELLRMPLRTLVHKIRAHGIKKTYAP